jgi:hypothetical protein
MTVYKNFIFGFARPSKTAFEILKIYDEKGLQIIPFLKFTDLFFHDIGIRNDRIYTLGQFKEGPWELIEINIDKKIISRRLPVATPRNPESQSYKNPQFLTIAQGAEIAVCLEPPNLNETQKLIVFDLSNWTSHVINTNQKVVPQPAITSSGKSIFFSSLENIYQPKLFCINIQDHKVKHIFDMQSKSGSGLYVYQIPNSNEMFVYGWPNESSTFMCRFDQNGSILDSATFFSAYTSRLGAFVDDSTFCLPSSNVPWGSNSVKNQQNAITLNFINVNTLNHIQAITVDCHDGILTSNLFFVLRND